MPPVNTRTKLPSSPPGAVNREEHMLKYWRVLREMRRTVDAQTAEIELLQAQIASMGSAGAQSTGAATFHAWNYLGDYIQDPDEIPIYSIARAKYMKVKRSDLVPEVVLPPVEHITIGTSGSGADYECDGTDDNDQFDAAIAAMSDGETLLILAGNYSFGATVTFSKSINIRGVSSSLVSITITATGRVFNVSGALKISGITFDSTVDQPWDIIKLGSGSDSVITNNVFKNTYNNSGVGIHFATSSNVLICRNTFSNLEYGVKVSTTTYNGIIEQNYFSDIDITCIQLVSSAPLARGIIRENYLWGVNSITHYDSDITAPSFFLKIESNHFRATNDGIEWEDDSTNGGSTGICITKNSFEPGGSRRKIRLKGVFNSNIEGNILTSLNSTTGEYLIKLEAGTVDNCEYNLITDNSGDAAAGTYAYIEGDASQNHNLLQGNKFVAGTSGTYDIQGANTNLWDEGISPLKKRVEISKGIKLPVATKTADYSMAETDYHIIADGSSASVAIDMDDVDNAVNNGQVWVITCEDKTNAVTVTATNGIYGGGLSGGATYTFASQYDSIRITWDNALGGFRIIE